MWKAQKSTKSGGKGKSGKDQKPEKCKKLTDLQPGPNQGADDKTAGTVQTSSALKTPDGIKNPEFQQQMQDVSKENLAETSQVNMKYEKNCQICEKMIQNIFGIENTKKQDAVEQVNDVSLENVRLQATTDKENEEKLMQKIEVIEETPLVEAEKKKIEGFNVTSNVLGDSADVQFSKDSKDNEEVANVKGNSGENNYPSDAVEKKVEIEYVNYQEQSNNEDASRDFKGRNAAESIYMVPNISQQSQNQNQEQQQYYQQDQQQYSQQDQQQYFQQDQQQYSQQGQQYAEQQQQHFQEQQLDYQQDNVRKCENESEGAQYLNFAEDSNKSSKAGAEGTDVQLSLDELAKRCLNSPSNQIDERLLKEMEKLGVPPTGTNRSGTPMIDADVIQMDVLKKPRKQVEKTEIDLESREIGKDLIDSKRECTEKLYPTFIPANLGIELADQKQDSDIPTLQYERLVNTFNEYLLDNKLNIVNKEQIEPLDNSSYVNEIQTEPNITISQQNKSADGCSYIKRENIEDEALENTTGNENESLTEIKRHYETELKKVTQMIEPRHKYDPKQVIPDPYDKRNIDNEQSDLDDRNVAKVHMPANKNDPVGSNYTLDTSDTQNNKSNAMLLNQVMINPNEKLVRANDSGESEIDHKILSETNKFADEKNIEKKNRHNISDTEKDESGTTRLPSSKTYTILAHELTAQAAAHDTFRLVSTPVQEEETSTLNAQPGTHQEASDANNKSNLDLKIENEADKKAIEYVSSITPKDTAEDIKPDFAHSQSIKEKDDEYKPKQITVSEPFSETPITYEYPAFHTYAHKYIEISKSKDKSKHSDLIKVAYKLRPKEKICGGFLQPDSMSENINAGKQLKENLSTLGPLPNMKEKEPSLTEMMNRVRARNRMEFCKEFEVQVLKSHATEVDPEEGKCGGGKKTPPCPPPAPKCPPEDPCPPPPCPPPPPPCPKPCKKKCPEPCPPKKSPCDKYIKKCYGTFKDIINILHLGRLSLNFKSEVASKTPEAAVSKAYLTEDIVAKLSTLGNLLKVMDSEGTLISVKTELKSPEQGTSGLALTKDFEPWTPIPCWPLPKKEKRRPLVCPKDGCKMHPPATHKQNQPVKQKPCSGFPRRHFSAQEPSPSSDPRALFDLGQI